MRHLQAEGHGFARNCLIGTAMLETTRGLTVRRWRAARTGRRSMVEVERYFGALTVCFDRRHAAQQRSSEMGGFRAAHLNSSVGGHARADSP